MKNSIQITSNIINAIETIKNSDLLVKLLKKYGKRKSK